jgi:hypothetical protein
MFTLKETLRKRKAKGLGSHCTFYDFIKCFDEISRDCIWKSMKVMGVSDKMIRAVKATLEGTSCKIKIFGVEKVVDMNEGTEQGTTVLLDLPCVISSSFLSS